MAEEKTSPEVTEQLLQIAEMVMSILIGNFPNEDRAEIESCALEGVRKAHEKKIPLEEDLGFKYAFTIAQRRLFDLIRKRLALKRNPEFPEQFREAVFGKLNGLDIPEYSQFLNGGYRDEIIIITERVRNSCSERIRSILDICLEHVPQPLSNEEIKSELASRGFQVSESTVRADRKELRRLGKEALEFYQNESETGNSIVA